MSRLVIALEKLGMSPKDFNILALPPTEMVRSLESGFLDAVSLNPPALFLATKKGFPIILDIGSLVEMPGGGLTVLDKDIKGKPDEVKASDPRHAIGQRCDAQIQRQEASTS